MGRLRVVFFAMATVMALVVLSLSFVLFRYDIRYEKEIAYASKTSGIAPELILAVIKNESSFRKDVVSHKGAVGLMQVMPSTADYVCDLNDIFYFDLFDPADNILIGSLYLKYLMQRFEKDLFLVIMAYNAGEGKVTNWLKMGGAKQNAYKETQIYLNKILADLNVFKKILPKNLKTLNCQPN